MSTTSPEVQAALRSMPVLIKLISEDATLKVKLSPTGDLCILRNRRWKIVDTDVEPSSARSLVSVIREYDGLVELGPWSFRALRSGDGWTVFGERRSQMETSNLDHDVRNALLEQAKRGGTGLFVGPPDSGKASLMLWLAAQLGRKSLVFVSELPPRQLPGPSATHVYPPTTRGERRDLERLLRAHDCIFWDRLNDPDDLSMLIDTPGVHNRWITMDAENPAEALLRLDFLSIGRLPIDFESFAVTGFNDKHEPCLFNLLCFERGEWREHFALSRSVKSLLQNQPEVPDERGLSSASSAPEEAPSTPPKNSQVDRHGMNVKELLQTDTLEREALIRASGEIDLQSFVKAREARRRALEEEAEREAALDPSADDRPDTQDEPEQPPRGIDDSRDGDAVTSRVDGEKVDEILSGMQPGDELPPELAEFDQSQLTPPSNDEITALNPVELENIRASAEDDEVSSLLDSDNYSFDSDDNASVLDGDSVASVLSGESSFSHDGAESGAYDVPDSSALSESGPIGSAPEESGPHAASSPHESGPHTGTADNEFRERTESGRHKIVRRSQAEQSSANRNDDKRESGERVIPTSWGSGEDSEQGSGSFKSASNGKKKRPKSGIHRKPSGSHRAVDKNQETKEDMTEEVTNVRDAIEQLDDSDS
ncbi:MAG: hypothetical protein ACQEVA_09480 [Myxococcota bacterium]